MFSERAGGRSNAKVKVFSVPSVNSEKGVLRGSVDLRASVRVVRESYTNPKSPRLKSPPRIVVELPPSQLSMTRA